MQKSLLFIRLHSPYEATVHLFCSSWFMMMDKCPVCVIFPTTTIMTHSHIYTCSFFGFRPMKPFKYVHSALSLMLLLLTVIFFLSLYLHSFITNLSSWGLRIMARHARQNVMTPKNFLERKHCIPGGSQVIDCKYFFSKKNQVFIFPNFIKIKSAILTF